MRNKSLILMTICAALSTGLSAQSIYPGQHAGKMKKVTTAPIQVESFDLKDVRLLPSRFRDNMMRDSVWMTSIATTRLLHSFRNNAGVFAGREGGYDRKETGRLGITGLRTARTYNRAFTISLCAHVRIYRK